MNKALFYIGLGGLAYVAYHVWKQGSTPGAGGYGAAFQNWAVSPLGIGSAVVVAYALSNR